MNIRNLISYGFLILVLGLVQILFLKNLAVFGHAFGFIYLLGLLILPSTIRTIPLMLIAFCLGRYISYAFPLLFVYALAFFIADQWGTGGFFGVLSKSFFSALFTLMLTLVVQLLFFSRKRGI
jgi:hypothetical protein